MSPPSFTPKALMFSSPPSLLQLPFSTLWISLSLCCFLWTMDVIIHIISVLSHFSLLFFPRSLSVCLSILPSSFKDSMDMALFLKFRESVDWDRIRRKPRGESSFRFLHAHTQTHMYTHSNPPCNSSYYIEIYSMQQSLPYIHVFHCCSTHNSIRSTSMSLPCVFCQLWTFYSKLLSNAFGGRGGIGTSEARVGHLKCGWQTHPAMLLVETLLASESPERTRRAPSSDCLRLSEG